MFNSNLGNETEKLLTQVNPSNSFIADVNTCMVLYKLAENKNWNKNDFGNADFLAGRFDISGRFFMGYSHAGKAVVKKVITDNNWLELAVVIFLKLAVINENTFPVELKLKRFNTLFKILDIIRPEWLTHDSSLGRQIELAYHSLSRDFMPISNNTGTAKFPTKAKVVKKTESLKTIPLTVLFYEGPIARSYLATIANLGYKPEKIIELVAAKDVVTKKHLGKWLPEEIRLTYASSIQRKKTHYWPKRLFKTQQHLINEILNQVKKKLAFNQIVFANAHALNPLSNYSDCIESILFEDLKDKQLQQYLMKEPAGVILYYGRRNYSYFNPEH